MKEIADFVKTYLPADETSIQFKHHVEMIKRLFEAAEAKAKAENRVLTLKEFLANYRR